MVSERVSKCLPASAALLPLAGTVAAQVPPESVPAISPFTSAAVSLLVHLVVGGFVVAVVPDYTRERVREIRAEPVESFIIGIAALISLLLASMIVITMIVTIPALLVLGIVGGVLATVALGVVIVEKFAETNLFAALLVGTVVSIVTGFVPYLGELFNFALSMMGAGAVATHFWSYWQGD
jgi:hypothetical protein